MKNAKIIKAPSNAFRIPIQGAPERHGWALSYVSGSEELDAEDGPLYMTDWQPDKGTCGWGDNPWLWNTEEDARKIQEYFKSNCEIETEVIYV